MPNRYYFRDTTQHYIMRASFAMAHGINIWPSDDVSFDMPRLRRIFIASFYFAYARDRESVMRRAACRQGAFIAAAALLFEL